MSSLFSTLKSRFTANPHRHPGVDWPSVAARLGGNPQALKTLQAMEDTGGEADVVGGVDPVGKITFMDCAPESPIGRRSLCFDRPALDARKANKPAGAALEIAGAMGITLLDEATYALLQSFGPVDQKTSSWIATPPDVRSKGGALFGDYRYGRVFFYHNGAESYYAARGFRGLVRV